MKSAWRDISIDLDTYNLVNALYEKGAHYVLGTTESIYTTTADEWIKTFADCVNSGVPIESINEAVWDELNPLYVPITVIKNGIEVEEIKEVFSLPIYDVGDKKQYLN